ncbi:kinase-like domain-containing protein [Lentinula raphanica]|uniref:Kinase-like domain-containing protein n=1 Tax=Lentinula raphanica TaxID=153919 RepID=A0AA38UGQ0_9AGAR|nr:kinase-like domain-containing protein [Lentinula raphanica]
MPELATIVDQVALPSSLSQNPRIVQQIQRLKTSEVAANVLESARVHRQSASQNRLQTVIPRAQNSSLRAATTSAIGKRQNSTTQTVLDMAQQKRLGSVQVLSSLWVSKIKRAGGKLEQLDRYSIDEMYPHDQLVKIVFDSILVKTRTAYEEGHPGTLENFTTRNVSFHAHQSKSQHSILRMVDLQDKTMNELLQHFATLGYITAQQVGIRKLSIRLVIDEKFLPEDDIWDDQVTTGSGNRSSLTSARRSSSAPVSHPTSARRSSSVLVSRATLARQSSSTLASHPIPKRKANNDLNPDTHQSRQSAATPSTPSGSGSSAPLVRKSAFRPRKLLAREVVLQRISFRTLLYNHEQRQFFLSKDLEEILLPVMWKEDEQLGLSRSRDSAYLGSGTAKHAFYAQYNGKEYAFVQCKPGCTVAENSKCLRAELENLADAHQLAEEFKEDLRKEGVKFPKFRFNYPGAFIGKLVDEDIENIAHFHEFLATPLLPCGEADSPIAKYTGNDNVGEPPRTDRSITALMHAYMHYTYVMSGKSLLICDIQGMFDDKMELCLIDPQSHSDNADIYNRSYWDGGKAKMESYVNHHIDSSNGCAQNRFCNDLQIMKIEIEN